MLKTDLEIMKMIQQIELFHLMDRGRHVVLVPLMMW